MDQFYDILVLGAGPSGIAAAAYAAKFGAKVALFEKNTIIGGTAFKANVHTLNGGSLSSMDGLLSSITKKAWDSIIFQPEDLLNKYYELLKQYKVSVFCGHTAISVKVEDSNLKSIVFSSETGKTTISAKIIIDASGVLEIENLTGTKSSENALNCYMSGLIGKVETVGGKCYSQEAKELLKEKSAYAKSVGKFSKELTISIQPTLRADIALLIIKYENSQNVNGSLMREKMDEAIQFLQEFGYGFENASLIVSSKEIFYSSQGSFNTKYTLSREEIVKNKYFNDQVAALPDDDEDDGRVYYIPYGSILSSKYDNLLLCGRNIGATANAMDLIDSIPTHFETGKAAGIAAAIANKNEIELDNVSSYEVISKAQDSVTKKIEILNEIVGEEDTIAELELEIIKDSDMDKANPSVNIISNDQDTPESFKALEIALNLVGEDVLGSTEKTVDVKNILDDFDTVMDIDTESIIKKQEPKQDSAESIIEKMAGFTKSIEINDQKKNNNEHLGINVKPFSEEYSEYDVSNISNNDDSLDSPTINTEPAKVLSKLFQIEDEEPNIIDDMSNDVVVEPIETIKEESENISEEVPNIIVESLSEPIEKNTEPEPIKAIVKPEPKDILLNQAQETSIKEPYPIEKGPFEKSLKDELESPKSIISNNDVLSLLYEQAEESNFSNGPLENLAQDELSLLYDEENIKPKTIKIDSAKKDKASTMLDMIYDIADPKDEDIHTEENIDIPEEWISKTEKTDTASKPFDNDKFKSIKDFLYDNDDQ